MKTKIKTLFKIEFSAPFRLLYGFFFFAVYWGFLAYLVIIHNFTYTTADISAILSSMSVVVLLIFPIITRFSIFDVDRKRKYSKISLFSTLPFSTFELIAAKFLANLAILGIANIPLLLLPIINGYFSVSDYLLSYSALFAFLLLEIAFLSISQFIAVKVKSDIALNIVNDVVFSLIFLMGSAKVLIPRSAVVSFVGTIVIGLLLGLLVYAITKKKLISVACSALLAALPIPFFLLNPESFEGILEKIIGAFSLFRRFDSFAIGAFDISAIILYLSIAIAFFLLTLKSFSRNEVKRINFSKFGKSGLKITCCFTAVLLVFSIFASVVASGALVLDSTQNNKYSVSQESKDYIKELDTEVTLYFINPTSVDESLSVFLQRYVSLSKNLKLEVIYPSTDADFFEKYDLNSDAVEEGSILVASDKRNILIYPGDLYTYSNDTYGENMSYSLYYQYLYYASLYDQEAYQSLLYNTVTCFQGDYVITSYVEYVARENLPTTFIISGHGEAELSDNTLKLFNGYGLTVDTLDLSSADSIPEYAMSVIINNPSEDISDVEYELLSSYLAKGGQMTLLTDESDMEKENLCKLLADYGMRAGFGAVFVDDGSAEIEPDMNYNHDITATLYQLNKNPVYLYEASCISFNKDAKDSLLLTPLLFFSDSDEGSESNEDFVFAASAETADGAKIVWITGATDFDIDKEDYSNTEMLLCASFWTTLGYDSELGEIAPVIHMYPSVEIDSAMSSVFKVLFVALPIFVLAYGVICFVKQKRIDKKK